MHHTHYTTGITVASHTHTHTHDHTHAPGPCRGGCTRGRARCVSACAPITCVSTPTRARGCLGVRCRACPGAYVSVCCRLCECRPGPPSPPGSLISGLGFVPLPPVPPLNSGSGSGSSAAPEAGSETPDSGSRRRASPSVTLRTPRCTPTASARERSREPASALSLDRAPGTGQSGRSARGGAGGGPPGPQAPPRQR